MLTDGGLRQILLNLAAVAHIASSGVDELVVVYARNARITAAQQRTIRSPC
jgi:anti-anti-sigma regulatory factor